VVNEVAIRAAGVVMREMAGWNSPLKRATCGVMGYVFRFVILTLRESGSGTDC
jgi:hypothetical protein